MRLIDLISLIAFNLGRRKGRVALTAIGVVIGTAAVVLLVALAAGLQENANSQITGMVDLTIINVSPKFDEMSFKSAGGPVTQPGGKPSASPQVKMLTNGTMRAIEKLSGVQSVVARESFNAQAMVAFGKLEYYPSIFALGTENLAGLGYELTQAGGTVQLEKGTALIGERALENFIDPRARPGDKPPSPPSLLNQSIKLTMTRYSQDGLAVEKKITLRIVGILKARNAESDYSMVVRMDELTAWKEWNNGGRRINRNKEGYEMLLVKAADSKNTTSLADQIIEMGYQAYTPQMMVEGINNFYTIIQVVFGGIGAIALLVAAIGIANTMTMAILERTREIGLMKAVGATNRNILSIFLGEAAGIGLIGGAGGIALAWLAAQLINILAGSYLAAQAGPTGASTINQVAFIAPWLPLFALGFSTLVGLLSGLYPALRAATMIPVLALKYE
jgi:putative ABC transport system permease protein